MKHFFFNGLLKTIVNECLEVKERKGWDRENTITSFYFICFSLVFKGLIRSFIVIVCVLEEGKVVEDKLLELLPLFNQAPCYWPVIMATAQCLKDVILNKFQNVPSNTCQKRLTSLILYLSRALLQATENLTTIKILIYLSNEAVCFLVNRSVLKL